MKHDTTIIFIVLFIAVTSGCTPDKQQKAEDVIKSLKDKKIHLPDSVGILYKNNIYELSKSEFN